MKLFAEEVEGTVLEKGYDETMKYNYTIGYDRFEAAYYVITLDTKYGKRMLWLKQESGLRTEIVGLEKIMEEGDLISFYTRHPEQPIHKKHPQEIILKKREKAVDER